MTHEQIAAIRAEYEAAKKKAHDHPGLFAYQMDVYDVCEEHFADLLELCERMHDMLYVTILCGGCGKRYRYNRVEDPEGDAATTTHYEAVPTCQGAEFRRMQSGKEPT